MGGNKKSLSGSNVSIFLLGLVCGVLFGRLLFGVAIAVLVVGAAIWLVCELHKR